MEPDFKEGDQVLVSTLNFKNLKGLKKMRYSFVGPFTIIKLIGKNAVEIRITDESPRNTQYSQKKTTTPPDIVEVEDSPGPVKKIIKSRKIRLNGKDQRPYLVRFETRQQTKTNGLKRMPYQMGAFI
ncbi:hypothetical protein O181_029619 [Austropuccinia psidii MF-1]|uniref:Uncharacterized protein n=1 Tax=Austropuccinia psidii MF-1 TaxID=1389203 RepID=A0A9Q3CSL8_9BASI|nr:hypothetical protein [Austropuccinia psidii MF-1]